MNTLKYIAVIIIVATTTIGTRWLSRRSKPAALGEGGGRITPGKISASVVIILALPMVVAGCAVAWSGDLPLGATILAVGAALVLFMAPSLTHWHDVVWTEAVIEGPSRMFGLTLGRSRTRIRWDEIALIGSSLTGYSFAEATDRRRVYWSYLYPGFGMFEEALRLRRPDLFGDAVAGRATSTTTQDMIRANTHRPLRPVIENDSGPDGNADVQPLSGDHDT